MCQTTISLSKYAEKITSSFPRNGSFESDIVVWHTLNQNFLPIVPITKGGTGTDNQLTAVASFGSGFAICNTSSVQTGAEMQAALASYSKIVGPVVSVRFNHDVPAQATLNINSTGASPIVIGSNPLSANAIKAGNLVSFVFDGTNFVATSISSEYKILQSPVTDPSASGDSISFIDSVTQNENGEITPTKKSVRAASTSQTGVVQLSNSYNGTSETTAVTEKALKDGLATKQPSGNYKTIQTAKADPAASGTTITVIDSIIQDTNGVITATKKTIQDSSTSQKGIVQLSNSYNGTSETNAVTEKALSGGLGTKVNVANIDVSNQSTTILQLVKNLFTSGSNHLDYARWYTVSDDASANITDKPVSGKGFLCEAKLYRSATSTDYAYFLTCIVKDNELNPFVAVVSNNTTTIVWTRLDTRNSAGSTDTSSKIFLVGATSQVANSQTYSDDEVYAQDGLLAAKEVQINSAAKWVWDSVNQCLKVVFN